MEKAVTGRFAPSPSGRMHLGNAFSCLLAWLSVRSSGGHMVLRHEDLDTGRCKDSYALMLEDDLRWLGLDWDEGGSQGGESYFQSHRTEIYSHCLNTLSAKGLLYPCFCSRADIHAASAPHAADAAPVYPGTCRSLSQAQRLELMEKRRPALRVRVPEESFEFMDGLQGLYSSRLDRDVGDFILRRSDGIYAYQLAVVADDALMGINQVVRGRDLLSSTPRQLWLQQLLGFDRPEYCHVPLLVDSQGRRLSKRDGDMDLGTLRARGESPRQIIGRLAFWAGLLEREEQASPQELIPLFDWKKVPKNDIVVKC